MTMETRNSMLGAIVSWTGTLGTAVFQNLNMLITLTCAGLAAAASLYSIFVARRQMRNLDREARRVDQQLCADCRAGSLPARCPIPPADRAKDCPHPKL